MGVSILPDSDTSLALQAIKEKIAVLNFASDATTALLQQDKISGSDAHRKLTSLSAERMILSEQRMDIILTGAVILAPTAPQVTALRKQVNKLYQYNAAVDAIDDLVATALALAKI